MAGKVVLGEIQDDQGNVGDVTSVIKGSSKAWASISGTGSVSIISSHNVSSVTDLGVGDYKIHFTSALPDGDYSVVSNVSQSTTTKYAPGHLVDCCNAVSRNTTDVTITTLNGNSSTAKKEDMSYVDVFIMR